jgi:hypothetical protein
MITLSMMRLGWLARCWKTSHCYQLVTIKTARLLRLFQASHHPQALASLVEDCS